MRFSTGVPDLLAGKLPPDMAAPPRPGAGEEPDRGLPRPLFEGAEHMALGNSATLYFGAGRGEPAAKTPLHVEDKLPLTYGQIVALAGDFFGNYRQPISDGATPEERARRFAVAFATLSETFMRVYYQAERILSQCMVTEIKTVEKALAEGRQPSTAYANMPDLTACFTLYTEGRYELLSLWNWDHFGEHAVRAYQAGHGVALAQAIAAGKITDPGRRRRALELAYARSAFTDHYLTDLFSAGHLRTPRRRLYEKVQLPLLGGILAWWMHDEDSKWGLVARDRDGFEWKAFGDKRLGDTVNLANRTQAELAVQASVDEIYEAFSRGTAPKPEDYAALSFVADLAAARAPGDRRHHSPMFFWDGTHLLRRRDLNDLGNYDWIQDWNGYETWQWLRQHYNPKPPTGQLLPPAGRPAFGGWNSDRPTPPNWVRGKRLRYAVSFFRDFEESEPGPWSERVTLADRFFPTLTGIPVDGSGRARGRRVWRQFDDGEYQLAGQIDDNSTTTFIDRKP